MNQQSSFSELWMQVLRVCLLFLCVNSADARLQSDCNRESPSRVNNYEDVNNQTIGYRYYDSGRLQKLIYPGGNETTGNVEYTYWQTGRLKNVIERLGATPRTSTFYWNKDGRLARIERPNGTKRVITYDTAGRPELIQELKSSDAVIASFDISYYDSDEIYQLAISPSIDPAQFNAPPSVALTFNADNQIATFEIPWLNGTPPGQGTANVTHDADGNMILGPLPSGQMASYTYNERNQLTSAGGLDYEYDAEGNRIGISGTENVSFVIDANRGLSRPIQITRNGVTTRYVYGIGLSYEVDASGNATYYHYDQTGNTVALTNQSQTVVAEYRYAPYGHLIYQSGSRYTPFLYGGFFAIHTDDNGLIHMRARYFNSLICRFVNSDPAQDGWNWYAYANGNPIMNIDPTGFGSQSSIQAMTAGYSFTFGSGGSSPGGSSYSAGDFARDAAGFVPVLGSALDAYDSFAAGNWGQGIAHSVLALSDLTGAGAIAKGLAVGTFRLSARAAVRAAYRSTGSWKSMQAGLVRRNVIVRNSHSVPRAQWRTTDHIFVKQRYGYSHQVTNHPANLQINVPQSLNSQFEHMSFLERAAHYPLWIKLGGAGVGSYTAGLFYNAEN